MLQPRIPRPERAEGTVLAALLVALLTLLVVVQFVLPQERPAVPEVPPAALRAGPAQIGAVSADPVLARRSIFQATRIAGGNTAGVGAPVGPLDGAIPAGIVRVRGAARLVLQTPDGKSVTLRPGQSWQGWRLISIGRDDVRFRRGGESVTLGLGANDSFSYPEYAPIPYDPRGPDNGYRPNQADEQ
jgi:hypothetical protein